MVNVLLAVVLAASFPAAKTETPLPANKSPLTHITGADFNGLRDALDGIVNARNRGCIPDDSTDDSECLQAAFNAAAGKILVIPPGTYLAAQNLYMGKQDGTERNRVHVIAPGAVIKKPATSSVNDWILAVDGIGHRIEGLSLLGEPKAGTASGWSANIGFFVRGYPMAGASGSLTVTKDGSFNVKVTRVGVGVQVGNYDVDGKDPDIETNEFPGLWVDECNVGLFINGQNILHNKFPSPHITNCRDYLVRQKRGGDFRADTGYFGKLYDALTAATPVHANPKVLIEAGHVALRSTRSEDNSGIARTTLSVTATDADTVLLDGNTFTTAGGTNATRSVLIQGSGSDGQLSTRAVLVNNEFDGYLELDTLDVVSLGNRYKGTGSGVVDGVKRSANQQSAGLAAKEFFLDGWSGAWWFGQGFTVTKGGTVTLQRDPPTTGSEWSGAFYADSGAYNWGRLGLRVTNATATDESALVVLGNRMDGSFRQAGIGFGLAAPLAGTYVAGDRVFNSAPAVGQPKGWICTVSGTPGTWVSEGNL